MMAFHPQQAHKAIEECVTPTAPCKFIAENQLSPAVRFEQLTITEAIP